MAKKNREAMGEEAAVEMSSDVDTSAPAPVMLPPPPPSNERPYRVWQYGSFCRYDKVHAPGDVLWLTPEEAATVGETLEPVEE